MLAVVFTVILVPLDFGAVARLGDADGLTSRGWALRMIMAGGPLIFIINDPGKAVERLVRHPLIGLSLALTWSVFLLPLSAAPKLSFVALISFSCTLFWLATAVDRVGWEAFERAAAFGLLLFVTGSIATDILGIGVVDNPGIAGIDFGRLKGFALHPNTLGAAAATLTLMCLAMVSRRNSVPWLPILGLPVGVLALLWTQSRTALLGLIIAVGFAVVPRAARFVLLISMVGVLVGAAAFGFFEGETWRNMSRAPENAANVSGLSGRPELWVETVRVISERPVIGYGIGTAPDVYRDTGVAWRTGWDPPDAHNEYLQSTLTMGVVGLAFVLWSLIGYWRAARLRPDKWRDAAVVLVMCASFTEAVLLAFLPSLTFVIMVAALASVGAPIRPDTGRPQQYA